MKTFKGHVKQALETHIEQNGLITSPDILIERIAQHVRRWLDDEDKRMKDPGYRGTTSLIDARTMIRGLKEGTEE